MNKTLVRILLGVSVLLMVAGWILPLLTLRITFEAPIIGKQTLLDETRSLLETIQQLTEDGNLFPALLITFFGVLVPLLKTVSLFYALAGRRNSHIVAGWMFSINKWAMADVFSMSILIAFLTAEHGQRFGGATDRVLCVYFVRDFVGYRVADGAPGFARTPPISGKKYSLAQRHRTVTFAQNP